MADLLPVPAIGSTNWSPWAAALQAVVVEHEAALAGKASTSHTHEGGTDGGGASGFIDGGGANATFTSTLDGGGAT